MDYMGLPEILFVVPWVLLGLIPYLLGIWAIVMLVQISRATREMAARLAAIEGAISRK
jgi:hypothetical protein